MEKEYKFVCVVEERARGYVTAENEEDAKQKILNEDYDDMVATYNMEIKEIVEIKEEK